MPSLFNTRKPDFLLPTAAEVLASDYEVPSSLLGACAGTPKVNPLLPNKGPGLLAPTNGLGFGMLASPPPLAGLGMLGMLAPPTTSTPAANNLPLTPTTKRKVYFAFRFRDIMRVNNVRNACCIDHPNSAQTRSFYDRSIWGGSSPKTDEGLKDLMRRGVEFSSAVCVLVGSDTWDGRWVKYEIARSVVDKKALLAVHINGLNHVDTQAPSLRGYNPLHCLGIFHSPNGAYYLYEKVPDVVDPQTGTLGWRWVPYEDFKNPVPLPRYIPFVQHGYIMPLSAYVREYDFVAEVGHKNIGAWIDQAALVVGR